MYPEKITSQVEAGVISESLPFPGRREVLSGYEIHMGRSVSGGEAKALFRIVRREGKPVDMEDGLAQPDGRAWGTYIHGIFDNDGFRNMFLEDVGRRSGKIVAPASGSFSFRLWKEEQYDRLAELVRKHVDVGRILDILLKLDLMIRSEMVFLPWHLASAYLLDLAAGDPRWAASPGPMDRPAYCPDRKCALCGIGLPRSHAGFGIRSLGHRDCSCPVRGEGVHRNHPPLQARLFGNLALIWLAYSTLATRSLHKESSQVAEALRTGDLALARARLSFIVSRDTSQLDRDAVLRALVETVSENICDAIVAPLFYLAFFGPVGALVYKAINTMDSMVGYKNERYRYFGSFAARADDVANWVPARISGWLLVGASACMGMDWRAAANIMMRDAPKMKSPNAGYPEAAAAGALGVQLGGASFYFGQPVEKPLLGEPVNQITLGDLRPDDPSYVPDLGAGFPHGRLHQVRHSPWMRASRSRPVSRSVENERGAFRAARGAPLRRGRCYTKLRP